MSDHSTSIVGITGTDNSDLYVLANLYTPPFDPEAVLSVVVKTVYSTESWCTSMDQHGANLFVVSMDGEMHISAAGQWRTMELECPGGLNAVWAAGESEAYSVGVEGEIVHVTGNSFTKFTDADKRRLNAIHGSSSKHIVAVGDEGLVYIFDGQTWTQLECPTNTNLLSVLCCSDSLVYVSGANGVFFRLNNGAFEAIEAPPAPITSLGLFNNSVYAATGKSGLHVLLDDNTTEQLKEFIVYRLRTVNERLFAVGNKLVAQFDGEGWWGGELDL